MGEDFHTRASSEYRRGGLGAAVDRVFSWLRAARARAAMRSELGRLDAWGELDPLLADMGLDRGALPHMVANHPRAPARLQGMLRRLGLAGPEAMDSTLESREIQRNCLRCGAGRECDHWLAGTTAAPSAPGFCPNAEAFDRLRAARHRR